MEPLVFGFLESLVQEREVCTFSPNVLFWLQMHKADINTFPEGFFSEQKHDRRGTHDRPSPLIMMIAKFAQCYEKQLPRWVAMDCELSRSKRACTLSLFILIRINS